jgi:transcription initiation factor TFIID TATA-box-binding protein
MTVIKIENIVARAHVTDGLDLKFLSDKIPDARYNPDEFNGLSLKYEDPKVAIIIMSSGKLFCTGAKNMDDVNSVLKKTVSKLKKIKISINKGYKIITENVVASTDFKQEMQLSTISRGLIMQHVEYEPEKFPGLIYKTDDSCEVLILFSSGKLVCTGAKSIDDVEKAINLMKEKLTSLGAL